MTNKVALQLQLEWEEEVVVVALASVDDLTAATISKYILRSFLFFVQCLSIRQGKIRHKDIGCIRTCFKILLESINSTGNALYYTCFSILLC